jgi:hypothetical protein
MTNHTVMRTLVVLGCLACWQISLRSSAQDGGVEIPASLGNDMPTNAPVEQVAQPDSNDGQQQAAAPSKPLPPQAQLDKEWLTAYMLAHQGYRLDHMDALEDAFGKMTPTQLATLRMMYEEKQKSAMQSEALYQRAQANAISMDEARVKRETAALNSIDTEDTSSANYEDQRLKIMHQEAAENYQQEQSLKSPAMGYPGFYGSPYAPVPPGGGYRYGY